MLSGPPKVRYNSFVTQPLDLLSWFYVYLLDFDLFGNLIHHLAFVRRLVDFATPLSPPRHYCCRLALRYTWRYIPVSGLTPERNSPYLAHQKNGLPNQ